MKLFAALHTFAATLFRRSRVERDMDEELRAHIANRTNDLMRAGFTRAEAERRARLEFGGYQKYKEEIRESLGAHFFETLLQDARYTFRMLRKSPAFIAVAVLTLALGIGANTAIFTIVDAALLRALPVKDPQQVVVLRWSAHSRPKIGGFSGYGDCIDHYCSFSLPFFRTMDANAKVFSGMAAFAGPLDMDLSGNGAASIAHGTFVSGDFFSTLGVNAFIGRPLTVSDDAPSAPPAIVLTHAYWQRAFGGDRSVIGRSIRLNNVPVTIVGVAEPHFTNLTPGNTQDLFLPCSVADRVKGEWWGNQSRTSNADIWWVIALGRLKPGVSIGQAQAAVTAIFRNEMLHGASPVFKEADAPEIHLLPAQAGLNGETSQIAPILYLLMFGVGFILLITCANVAGLMLARSATRQKEMSVRLALGAARTRLIRQLITESVLMSLLGAAFGILFAVWGVKAFVELFSSGYVEFPFVIAPDWRVLTFTIAITFITGILFGLAPALRGTRVDLTPSLKENASSLPGASTHAKRFFRLGDALVIAQVALSIVVLISAGLLVRTMRNLQTLNPGFDARNVLLFKLDPTIAGYTDAQTQRLYSNLQEQFAALPGVTSASYSEDALLDGGHSGDDVHLDGAPPKHNVNTGILPVGLNFFSTMHIPLLAGHTFTSADFAAAIRTNAAQSALSAAAAKQKSAADPASASALALAQQAYTRSAPIPVLINETFAKKFLSRQNPVGLHMGDAQGDNWTEAAPHGPGYTIIGVVADTKYARLRKPIEPIMFQPLVSNSAYFELRAVGNPTALVKNVRDIVSRAADNLPLTELRTQTEQIDQTLFLERLLSRLSSFFGVLALVLACIGLYGLLAYEVARRTREIGIRMALGAQQRDLLRLVVGQGILLAVIGSAIGIAAALGVTRFISSMLFGVRANDPLTIIAVAILLGLVALLACYIPAKRATRVDPIAALRYE